MTRLPANQPVERTRYGGRSETSRLAVRAAHRQR